MKPVYLSFIFLLSSVVFASDQQPSASDRFSELEEKLKQLESTIEHYQDYEKKWEFTSYGTMSYQSTERFENVQDTEPERRASTDIERVVAEFKYFPANNWEVEVEVEIEHGGVGVAMEYDGFDEFGEFETEVESGGEVVIEKAQIEYQANDAIGVKFGRIIVPVGLGSDLTKPNQYFTASRHWAGATMIPQVWNETGVNVFGSVNHFKYQALLTTGLNSEFFRTGTWVSGGHQNRFESVNADALALTVRLDYGDVKADQGFGVSYYVSNTSANRNNQGKIDEAGTLAILSIHGAYTIGAAIVRGQYLIGSLDDTSAITNANKTTPGLNAGAFSQLGSKAESWYLEAGVNIQPAFSLDNPTYLFITSEYSNPIKEVESGSFSNRYEISEIGMGLNYFPIPELVLKAQLSTIESAQIDIPTTQTFALSAGYQFSM